MCGVSGEAHISRSLCTLGLVAVLVTVRSLGLYLCVGLSLPTTTCAISIAGWITRHVLSFDLFTPDRYLNQTWGAAYGQQLESTATSALGHLLSRGSLLGAGVHGANHGGAPSGTSQWYRCRHPVFVLPATACAWCCGSECSLLPRDARAPTGTRSTSG